MADQDPWKKLKDVFSKYEEESKEQRGLISQFEGMLQLSDKYRDLAPEEIFNPDSCIKITEAHAKIFFSRSFKDDPHTQGKEIQVIK